MLMDLLWCSSTQIHLHTTTYVRINNFCPHNIFVFHIILFWLSSFISWTSSERQASNHHSRSKTLPCHEFHTLIHLSLVLYSVLHVSIFSHENENMNLTFSLCSIDYACIIIVNFEEIVWSFFIELWLVI